MEAVILLYASLFMFAVSGLLFVGAYQKYTHATQMMMETRRIAGRVLLRNRRG